MFLGLGSFSFFAGHTLRTDNAGFKHTACEAVDVRSDLAEFEAKAKVARELFVAKAEQLVLEATACVK